MKTYFPHLASLSLAACLFQSGCHSTRTQVLHNDLDANRKATEGVGKALVAHGLATLANDPSPLQQVAKENGVVADVADKRFKEIQDDLNKQKQEFQTFVTGALASVGEAAASLVPGGSAAAKVIGIIKNRIDTAQTGAAEAKQESEAAKKDAASALVDAQKQLAGLKAELAAKEELAKQHAAAKEEQLKRDIEFARKEFTALSEQQKTATRAELLKLAQEKGIQGAEGMTTEELLAALGAAGIGLAGLLRTFGKSRSASELKELATTQDDHAGKIDQATHEVDEVWTDMKKLEAKVAVLEGQAGACDCAAIDKNLTEHTSALDDHERRIDKLEAKGNP